MPGKKVISNLRFPILFLIWICLVGFPISAIAETIKFKLYHYPVRIEKASINDVEGHSMNQMVRRGSVVIENGELATWMGVFQTDLIKGSGSFKSYATITFSDGSTIMVKAEGKQGGTGKAAIQTAESKSEIIRGTGRFEGVKGTLISTTKFLPVEKGEEGQKGVSEATLNYTLPSK